jgi:hypothetical protein
MAQPVQRPRIDTVTNDPSEVKQQPSRLRKWSKRIAIAIAALWIFAVVGGNIFLKSGLFKSLMAFDPEAMTMEYESAYSWFPLRVHVDNLTVRGSDSHVQWLLTVDHADTFIWPWDFGRQRIHTSETHATGVSFVMRTRHAPGDVGPDLLTSLPHIPGFSDPPLTVPIPPPPSDKDYNLWSVDLEQVTADHVREVWIDTVRTTGDIHMTGRWLFKPLRTLDFGPSQIDIANAEVKEGNLQIAKDVQGQVTLRIFPFDPRVPKGADMLDYFSGSAKVASTISIDGLDHLLALKTAHFSDGDVTLHTDARLDHGTISSGSHADVAVSQTKLQVSSDSLKLAVQTALTANFDVDETATLVGRVRTENLTITKAGAPSATAELQTEITGKELRIAHGFDDASFHVHATNVQTTSIEKWISPDDKNSVWASGAMRADADVDVSQKPSRVTGNIYFAFSDAAIANDSLRISTDLKGEAKIEDGSIDEKRIDALVDFETPQGVVTRVGQLRVTSRVAAHVHLKARTEPDLRVDVSGSEVHLRDALADVGANESLRIFTAPEITLRAPKAIVTNSSMQGTVVLDLPRADSTDISTLRDLVPFPDSLKLVGGTAHADAHATLDLASLTGNGELNVIANRVDVRIDKTQIYGNLGLRVRAARKENGSTDLSGSSVAFARADAPNAPRNTDAWSAKFDVPQATLVMSPNPYFSAALVGEATDASPATMFVSGTTGIPEWLTNAFRMRGLKVSSGLLVAPSRIEVQGLDARGDGSFVRFEYAHLGGMKDGAIYIGTGPFAAGIDLAGGGARLVLLGAQKWFDEDVAKLRRKEGEAVKIP